MNLCSRTFALIDTRSMQTLAHFAPVATALVVVSKSANATDAPKRVLFLISYNYTLPGTTVTSQGARARLVEKSANKIEAKAVCLYAVRYSKPEREAAPSAFLRDGYARADQ